MPAIDAASICEALIAAEPKAFCRSRSASLIFFGNSLVSSPSPTSKLPIGLPAILLTSVTLSECVALFFQIASSCLPLPLWWFFADQFVSRNLLFHIAAGVHQICDGPGHS